MNKDKNGTVSVASGESDFKIDDIIEKLLSVKK
jgi:hypothetical protein